MNLNEKLKNYLTHEENDFLKVENSYNKKTSYLVGFEFASGSFNNLKVERVFSEVFAANEKAHNLYKKFNFKDISEKTVNNKKVICMELENENR